MLQVGDEVGGQQHRELSVRDLAHQFRQERPACQWIQAGDGFVEHHQVGTLGQRDRERHLRALTAGELAPRRSGGIASLSNRAAADA